MLMGCLGMILITHHHHCYQQKCLQRSFQNIKCTVEVKKVVNVRHAPHRSYFLATIKNPLFLKGVTLYLKKSQQEQWRWFRNLEPGDELTFRSNIWPFYQKKTHHIKNVFFFDPLRWYLQDVHGFGKIRYVEEHGLHKRNLIDRWRRIIDQTFEKNMAPHQAAIACALVTGNKNTISKTTRDDFINAGLAHVLAISGLHLGIIAAWCFFIMRKVLCLFVGEGRYVGLKKIAAMGALLMCALYMAIAGFGIPVQRAMMMMTFSMVAVMTERSSVAMRALCIAAFIILCFQPNAIFSPSFQLSFAAVLALLGVWQSSQYNDIAWNEKHLSINQPTKKIIGYVGEKFQWCFHLLIATAVATIATIPFTLLHFNRFTLHSFWTNLIAIPLTSYWVMPMGFFACMSIPFGGVGLFFDLFGKGIDYLARLSHFASTIPMGQYIVQSPSHGSMAIFTIGLLWLCLWQQSWRYLGIVGVVGSMVMMLT